MTIKHNIIINTPDRVIIKNHFDEWSVGSGVKQQLIEDNVRSVLSKRDVADLLGWNCNCNSGWWVHGIDPVTGEDRRFGQFKPDQPIVMGDKVAKYLTPKGLLSQAIFLKNRENPHFWQDALKSDCPIYITEGAKKAASLLQHGKATIALTGVWNALVFRQQLIADLALFAKAGRQFLICFDSDQLTNRNVQMAVNRLSIVLANQHHCKVTNVLLPPETKGVDDFLLANGLHSFEALCVGSKANTKSASVPEALFLAQTLAERKRDSLCFEMASGKWFAYEYEHKGIWKKLNSTEIQGILQQFLETEYPNTAFSYAYLMNVLNLLRPKLKVQELTRPPRTIPFTNGLFFLDSCELRDYKPQYYCAMAPALAYDPLATCKNIDEFLTFCTAPNRGNKELLVGILCLALSQITRYQIFFELIGPGNSGKSTFINLITAIVGKCNVFSTDLSHLENSRFETANLKDKSVIIITEGERFLDKSAMLKRIVGGDLIRFEEKYEQPGEGFYCRAIVLVAANEITQFADQNSGLFRRRITIPFPHRVPPEKRRNLLEFDRSGRPIGELASELPGLANLAIQKLNNAASIDALFRNPFQLPGVQAGFLLSADENPLLSFIKNDCIFHPKFSTDFNDHYNSSEITSSLYGCYVRFCQGHNYRPMASNRFFSRFLDACTNIFNLPFVYKHRKSSGYSMRGVHVFRFTPLENTLQYKELSSNYPFFETCIFRNLSDSEPLEVFRLRDTQSTPPPQV